jgi:hypothetical protein
VSHNEWESLGDGVTHLGAEEIFGLKKDEVTGEWRRLHNKELFDWFSSPNNTSVVKSRNL